MNEQQNTDSIKAMYAAFARGDVQSILGQLTSDVEWRLDGPAVIPYAGTRRGPAEVVGFFQALATTQEDMILTTDHFIAQGDTVATIGRYAATIKATGRHIDSAIAHFFTFRDGKVSRFVDFGDTADMADAYTHAAAATR
jgi:ketosteroid isomerase-like protein